MKLIIILMFLSTYAYATDCKKHPIYCQIKKNTPTMSKYRAMKLSNVIYRAARTHKIPANIYTAILKQESNYSIAAKGCHKGMMEVSGSEVDGVALVEVKICSDFGMSQIYYKTAKRYKFDITRLVSDLKYSVNAGAKVLAGFKRFKKKDKDWWVRYNCGNRSTTKRDTCQIYKKLVERYL